MRYTYDRNNGTVNIPIELGQENLTLSGFDLYKLSTLYSIGNRYDYLVNEDLEFNIEGLTDDEIWDICCLVESDILYNEHTGDIEREYIAQEIENIRRKKNER